MYNSSFKDNINHELKKTAKDELDFLRKISIGQSVGLTEFSTKIPTEKLGSRYLISSLWWA